MIDEQHPDRLEIEDLRINQALYGLDERDEDKLRQLCDKLNLEFDDDSFELTAAAFDLAICRESTEDLPMVLRTQIVSDAAKCLTPQRADGNASSFEGIKSQLDGAFQNPNNEIQNARPYSFGRRELFGILAIAACLLFAVIGWLPKRASPQQTVDLSVEARFERLLKDRPADLLELGWTPSEDVSAVSASGEVIWSDSRQEGFMVFKDLEINSPSEQQYQLWIFDSERDARFPVDGGVFDIADDGRVIVPIRAKLPVEKATMFAVTVEEPGGVVVSGRERISLIATAE